MPLLSRMNGSQLKPKTAATTKISNRAARAGLTLARYSPSMASLRFCDYLWIRRPDQMSSFLVLVGSVVEATAT